MLGLIITTSIIVVLIITLIVLTIISNRSFKKFLEEQKNIKMNGMDELEGKEV